MSVAGALAALGAPVQIAYAVPDVDVAARAWADRFGAGPFFVRRHIALADVMYRGAPAEFDHSSAYGQWGALMVELVADHTDGPTVVNDRRGAAFTGLHHVAFIVHDLDAALKLLIASGFEVAMSARTKDATRFHFVDTVAALGHYIELYQRSPRVTGFYDMVADAARGWDGSRPVREM